MTRGRNPGVGRQCPNCDRSILPGQHTRRRNGAWEHRDCQYAAAIAYNRAHRPGRTRPEPVARTRDTGIPAVIESRTGHLDDGTAERVIANGRRKPRILDEPSPGRAGGGHDR